MFVVAETWATNGAPMFGFLAKSPVQVTVVASFAGIAKGAQSFITEADSTVELILYLAPLATLSK